MVISTCTVLENVWCGCVRMGPLNIGCGLCDMIYTIYGRCKGTASRLNNLQCRTETKKPSPFCTEYNLIQNSHPASALRPMRQ